MSNTVVLLKKNTSTGIAPDATDLYQAELAINTADADLFTKRDDGIVLKQSIGTVQSDIAELTTTTADQIIDSFDAMLYRSAKYVVQATHGTDFQTIEILLLHDGSDVYVTRYGLMYTNTELATFTAEYDAGTDVINLLTTPANIDTTFKFTRTSVLA